MADARYRGPGSGQYAPNAHPACADACQFHRVAQMTDTFKQIHALERQAGIVTDDAEGQ